MKRREFIALVGGAAAAPLALPVTARTQQPPIPVIGYLSARSVETDVPMVTAFRQGLTQSGYVEGQNVAIEYRWGDGQYDRLPVLVNDLVRRDVTVIVTSGGETSAVAAKAATASIPIVFNVGNDPVRFGLVASLARPGGNLTGVTSFSGALGAKRLGLLRELVPTAAVIALLVNPNEAFGEVITGDIEEAARIVGQQLIVLRASTEPEIDAAFATLVQQRAGALLVGPGPFFVTRKDRLVALAARHAVPAMYFRRELAEAGGLVSYGSTTSEGYRQMGGYAGRILKGEKPADLPVLQPTKFELVINLKTAKALGIAIPNSMQLLADEAIE
jgi:putative ABC transport system substrate-binding protein